MVDLGGGGRTGVIGRLRRLLHPARPGPAGDPSREAGAARFGLGEGRREGGEVARRIDAARRRLKATIPPPEE